MLSPQHTTIVEWTSCYSAQREMPRGPSNSDSDPNWTLSRRPRLTAFSAERSVASNSSVAAVRTCLAEEAIVTRRGGLLTGLLYVLD
jgi:hypothetical protein